MGQGQDWNWYVEGKMYETQLNFDRSGLMWIIMKISQIFNIILSLNLQHLFSMLRLGMPT